MKILLIHTPQMIGTTPKRSAYSHNIEILLNPFGGRHILGNEAKGDLKSLL